MIIPPNPSSFTPIVVPEPETLYKYGKIALFCLRSIRKQVKKQGREHRKFFEQF